MTYNLESGIAQAGPCEISRRTMTTPFQRGLGSWTQYRSMFDLAVSDEVDLHFGPRDRSVSYDQVMRDLISLIEDKV